MGSVWSKEDPNNAKKEKQTIQMGSSPLRVSKV